MRERAVAQLAKIHADKPEDDEALRKKLWLKIARHVIETERDIKSAIDFLTQSELLKIEDILPFFPEFQRIDDFKQGTHGTEGTEGYSAYCMHWRVGLRDLRVLMGTRGTEGTDWYPGALRVLRVLIGTQETNWYPGYQGY